MFWYSEAFLSTKLFVLASLMKYYLLDVLISQETVVHRVVFTKSPVPLILKSKNGG